VHAAGGLFYKLTSKKRLLRRRPPSSSEPSDSNDGGLSAAAATNNSSGPAAAAEASPPSDSPQSEVEATSNKASLSTKLREPSFLQLVLPWCAARWAARYPNLWHLINRKLGLLEVQIVLQTDIQPLVLVCMLSVAGLIAIVCPSLCTLLLKCSFLLFWHPCLYSNLSFLFFLPCQVTRAQWRIVTFG